MKKKKFAFLSLMLAFLMALSLVLVACGGGEEDKKPGGNEPGGNEPGGNEPGGNEPGGNTGDEADVIRGGTTGGGAVALVDESVTRLADKLYVMYTFEDVMSTDTSKNTIVAGYDPYTGEAIRLSGTDSDEFEAYYGSGTSPLVSASSMTVPTGGQTAAVEGSESQTVYNVNSNYIRLGAFPDEYFPEITSDYFVDDDETASEVAKGISFSFWAYNYETVEGAAEGSEDGSDWSNVINTDKMSVTWGNITNKDVTGDSYTAIYPKSMATIGRAAYTQSGYELVRQYMTNSQMAAAPSTTVGIVPGDEGSADSPSYYVYNAVSGNIGDPDTDTQYLKDNAADMLGKWRYVTISIDYTDGISFYDNGVLAYNYKPSVFTSGDKWVGDRTSNNGQYDTLLLAMMQGVQGESWGSNFWADLFNGYANIYVDDLIIGAALDASDAEVLYETLSGNELTEADTQFNSLVTGDDEARIEAEDAAKEAYLAERQETLFDDIKAAKAEFISGFDAGDYIDVVGTTALNGGLSSSKGTQYFKPTEGADGSVNMTVSGWALSTNTTGGANPWFYPVTEVYDVARNRIGQLRFDNYVLTWNTASATAAPSRTWDEATCFDHATYAWLEVSYVYDGTSDYATITYRVYDYDQATVAKLQADYKNTQGQTVEHSIDYAIKEDTLSTTVTYTITATEGLGFDLAGMALLFKDDSCMYAIESVTGGTRMETLPEPSEVVVNQMAETYTNDWTISSKWAQVVLPEGDFDITYTADIYTAQASAWHGPAFVLAESDTADLTGEPTGQIVHIRSDNYAGGSAHLTGNNNGGAGLDASHTMLAGITYTTSAAADAFAYTTTGVAWTKTEGNTTTNLIGIEGRSIACNIKRVGSNYTVTYTDTETNTVLYAFTFTFESSSSLVLGIGGEATYFENIQISGAENLVLSKTTSGTKTQVDTTGFTQVTA